MANHRWDVFVCLLVLLGVSGSNSCPPPCKCDNTTIACEECPKSYVNLDDRVERLSIGNCKDVQYLLRLHQRHDESPSNSSKPMLSTLEIRDSFVRQPESFIYSDYDIRSLILSNDSIVKLASEGRSVNLTALDLSHNLIEFLDNRTFVNVDKLTRLSLSDNRISDMADLCFEGLGKLLHLDLSSNNLTRLSDTVFTPLMSLQHLNLSTNQLAVLSEKSFSSLLMLQQLDISYNRLTSVAPGTLQFLPNLAKLVMTDNPQLRPDAQVFVGTGRRLQQVDASRTGLSQVPEALTHSVRYLTLAGNRIAMVRCGDLDSYPLLQMLNFADNIIHEIEDDALGRLEMLAELYLNRNRLTTVPKMLPDRLAYLSLDSNAIRNLTITDLVSLPSLKVLVLSNNNISFIQENVFLQLMGLETLDLSSNPLKFLTPNTFSGPISLRDLRISHVNISPPAKDISFPVPSPEGIENLHLEHSPGLTRQLMADTAALAAMTRLQLLDMRHSNITTLRSDLLHFFPGLKTLKLEGNELNCTEVGWLVDWMKDHPDDDDVRCHTPQSLNGTLVRDLNQTSRHEGNISNAITPIEATKSTPKTMNRWETGEKIQGSSPVRKKSKVSFTDLIYSTKKNSKPNESEWESANMNTNHSANESDSPAEPASRRDLMEIFSEWSQEPPKDRTKVRSPCGNSTECGDKIRAETTSPTYEEVHLEVQVGNVSEYRTSRFSAEASGGNVGIFAAIGAAVAIVSAAAAAWASRRRPRPRQDMMEVPTIAAVGELW